jgi:hypothetical protein
MGVANEKAEDGATTNSWDKHAITNKCDEQVQSHVTRHTSHVARHTSHVTLHTSTETRHTSHVTRHTSHVALHTSHVTRHTSHVTRHTSHVTHHTSHNTRHIIDTHNCMFISRLQPRRKSNTRTHAHMPRALSRDQGVQAAARGATGTPFSSHHAAIILRTVMFGMSILWSKGVLVWGDTSCVFIHSSME